MLYHFAITPDVFEYASMKEMSPPGIVLEELLRGMCDNGLLADLHAGQWLAAVRKNQLARELPSELRDSIESLLNVLYSRNRIVRHPTASANFRDNDYRWLHWSLERHNAVPLTGVFITDAILELSELQNTLLVRLSKALGSSCWVDRKRSVSFTKISSNLQQHLAPNLRYANKVSLIDPYMNCREDRFLNTVQHCANLLGRKDGKQNLGTIHIHAGDPQNTGPVEHRESSGDRLNRWSTELRQIVRQWGHTFRVFLWGRKRTPLGFGRDFHDRYIITDQIGISTPGGLDFLEDQDEYRAFQTSWTALDPEISRSVLSDEFHESKSPYLFLDKIEARP